MPVYEQHALPKRTHRVTEHHACAVSCTCTTALSCMQTQVEMLDTLSDLCTHSHARLTCAHMHLHALTCTTVMHNCFLCHTGARPAGGAVVDAGQHGGSGGSPPHPRLPPHSCPCLCSALREPPGTHTLSVICHMAQSSD